MQMDKPKRTFSRRTVACTLIPAWAAIGGSIWHSVAMAQVVIPPMVLLIGAVIGVYQSVGHFDLRSQLAAGARPRRQPEPKP